jgi:uncharacterized protein (DUF58 family)
LAEASSAQTRGSQQRAEALGGALPPLLVAAERIAATVAQGVHGRRRTGRGDSFWQYRPLGPGDSASRVDWRQSARSDRLFVRETEWEAAQTVHLWLADGPAMRWHSPGVESRRERGALLLLALASLLLRGGERVRLLGAPPHPATGRPALAAMASLLDQPGSETPPAATAVPRHATVVLFSDFLAPLEEIRAEIARFAALPAAGHILQLLDPAEAELPFEGRIRFRGVSGGEGILIPRVEDVRESYRRRLAAQVAGVGAIAAAAGWRAGLHRTDHAASGALLALHQALAPT